ncbi:MAG: ATP phosphoribosyltransferase regulatory subunit, partial [Phycisphaerales bacterium]|nr:ATP phosphoribosyltransferase regulatory subunit [Phycisphaerales bacterium]
ITETWRAVSIRHAFEEIDAPTFEHADLYAVKSGEGILSELFQAFSGKDESEIAQLRETGRAPFALRPEFTPSLARMYAARAKQLPKPTRWFCIPNFFRAEKPQRGRLREFFQWNCDVIGGEDLPQDDTAVIAVAIGAFDAFGCAPSNMQIRLSDRESVSNLMVTNAGV